jgi:starch phosphorylase
MPLSPFLPRTHIAYFAMEMAIRPEMHTYSGGLGVLAGDSARSAADLELHMVFVTLVSRAGYFRQQIDPDGRQRDVPDVWDPASWCTPLDATIAVTIEGRQVSIRPWLYVHTSTDGHQIPIVLLDTDVEQNRKADRTLTHHLYGGDEAYRIKQEIVLGLGGIRVLRALGFNIDTYHLNEGHAAFLTLDLLRQFTGPPGEADPGELPDEIAKVRDRCVFTTHTPVEAGHDRFSYDLCTRILPDDLIGLDELKRLAGSDRLNMTRLALSLSGYVNGVARMHAETTARMFPGHRIHAVTNGIHLETWAHEAFARLYTERFPHWRQEPAMLVRAIELPEDEVWDCHRAAKSDLIARVSETVGVSLDPDVPTICYARRMTAYKRPTLLFSDLDRLAAIAERHPFQIVMAGKAHPNDSDGKKMIAEAHRIMRRLEGKITCAFLPNYDMDVAKACVAGADVWLNTPVPPMEASGTSGMKAALNGVLNLSVLDGWWPEGCIEGVTGWAIEGHGSKPPDGAALYGKLGKTVLPLYHEHPERWRRMMKQAIAYVPYYFNTHRMMRRYAAEAYLK